MLPLVWLLTFEYGWFKSLAFISSVEGQERKNRDPVAFKLYFLEYLCLISKEFAEIYGKREYANHK